jgi:hypothetical protein
MPGLSNSGEPLPWTWPCSDVHPSRWQNAIAKTIQEAIEQHELPKTAKADGLAALVVNSWEGAQVRAKAEQSDKPLDLFFDLTFNLLLKNQELIFLQ